MARARRGLRVVAGEAGGLRLVVPPRARPTTDFVREAVFAALGPAAVDDASVLDLYAGSGALAIEALSRGAARAVLVDRDRRAVDACRRNLTTTHFEARARVQARSVAGFLAGAPPAEAPFDLVCCDPPYDAGADEVAAVIVPLASPGWVAPGGLVVVERPAAAAAIVTPGGWQTEWARRYGDTLVSVLRAPGARAPSRAS